MADEGKTELDDHCENVMRIGGIEKSTESVLFSDGF